MAFYLPPLPIFVSDVEIEIHVVVRAVVVFQMIEMKTDVLFFEEHLLQAIRHPRASCRITSLFSRGDQMNDAFVSRSADDFALDAVVGPFEFSHCFTSFQ
jgi:hypothetical protein